ncbi:MAG TPA: TetR/AcrR family transcriptional regulator [Acidimicrobiales bacterium]|nr:TetR/AcrR family transcriptional regulator [Acidimicrobiales bacterium]
MKVSRQEAIVTKSSGRVNQKARTRAALLAAAVQLVREGRPPSVPDAAERALVSVATAYRYFPTADDLWIEASFETMDFTEMNAGIERALESAGDDPAARLDAVVKGIGWDMLDNPLPYRTMVKLASDRWFAQQQSSASESAPIREGRRHHWNERVLEPVRGTLTDAERRRLIAALDVAWGTEAAISLVDVAGLDVDDAKRVMLQTAQWVLAAGLADAKGRARAKG